MMGVVGWMDDGGWGICIGRGHCDGSRGRTVARQFSPPMHVCKSMHRLCLKQGLARNGRGNTVGWVGRASFDQPVGPPAGWGPSNNINQPIRQTINKPARRPDSGFRRR